MRGLETYCTHRVTQPLLWGCAYLVRLPFNGCHLRVYRGVLHLPPFLVMNTTPEVGKYFGLPLLLLLLFHQVPLLCKICYSWERTTNLLIFVFTVVLWWFSFTTTKGILHLFCTTFQASSSLLCLPLFFFFSERSHTVLTFFFAAPYTGICNQVWFSQGVLHLSFLGNVPSHCLSQNWSPPVRRRDLCMYKAFWVCYSSTPSFACSPCTQWNVEIFYVPCSRHSLASEEHLHFRSKSLWFKCT